jgi:glycine cleavage system H protein
MMYPSENAEESFRFRYGARDFVRASRFLFFYASIKPSYFLEGTHMKLQNDRKYTESHEWLLDLGNGTYRVGLSDYAQESLGDIVFVELPQAGDALETGVSLGEIESVKAVSEIISPVSGTVSAVNEELAASPESINGDPYGAWLVEVTDVTETAELLDADAYKTVCEQA